MQKLAKIIQNSSPRGSFCVKVHDFALEKAIEEFAQAGIEFERLDVEESFLKSAKEFLTRLGEKYHRNSDAAKFGKTIAQAMLDRKKHLLITIRGDVVYKANREKALARGLVSLYRHLTQRDGAKDAYRYYPIVFIDPQLHFPDRELFSELIVYRPYFPKIDLSIDVAVGVDLCQLPHA